jgi:hypothetical protein
VTPSYIHLSWYCSVGVLFISMAAGTMLQLYAMIWVLFNWYLPVALERLQHATQINPLDTSCGNKDKKHSGIISLKLLIRYS